MSIVLAGCSPPTRWPTTPNANFHRTAFDSVQAASVTWDWANLRAMLRQQISLATAGGSLRSEAYRPRDRDMDKATNPRPIIVNAQFFWGRIPVATKTARQRRFSCGCRVSVSKRSISQFLNAGRRKGVANSWYEIPDGLIEIITFSWLPDSIVDPNRCRSTTLCPVLLGGSSKKGVGLKV